jgi:phage tail sheath protein FI
MSSLTFPGVYINERPGAPSPIAGAGGATLALVGWTQKGAINDPVLVTGFKEFERQFGGFIADGLVPITLHSFFKNGGTLARIVRVAPSDAVASKAYFSEAVSDEDSGDNFDNSTTSFDFSVDASPVEPGTFTHSHYYVDSTVTGATAVTTAPNGTIAIWKSSGASGGEGTFAPITLTGLVGVKPGSVTINWTSGSVAKSMTDNSAGAFTGDGSASSSTINYLTGAVVLNTTGAVPDSGLASTITITYKKIARSTDCEDDGEGGLSGTNIAAGSTIDYETGAVVINYTKAPSSNYPSGAAAATSSADLKVSYSNVLWELNLRWPGAAGNSYSVSLSGTPGNEDDDAATFTRWTLSLLDGDTVVERFESLDFDDSTSASFFPTVVNDSRSGSKILTVVDVGNTGVPSSLAGIEYTAEVVTPSPAIDGTETGFAFTVDAETVYPTSLTISFVDGTTKTVTDDGDGNLIGQVSGSESSTVDYLTGEVAVTFSGAPDAASSITVSYYSKPAATSVVELFSGGSDGSTITSSDVIGASLEADMKGLYALNKTDDLLLVVTPDFAGNETVDQAVLDYCTARMDRFAILTTPEGTSYSDAVTYKRRTLARNTTSYGAIYWPWVQILDPITSTAINIPPVGHVAGVYARTDASRNIGKAPAGAQDGALRFLLGLEASPTKDQVGVLNQGHVNALVDWPQVGSPAVWGARTLQVNGEYKYIQARRLMMFLQKSIYNATHIYVFESNGSALWARIRLQLTSFLSSLFQQGYFAGNTPEEAFFVVVDSTNNPQTSIDAGELYVDIGIAPNKPAEFIVFRFQQKFPG